MDSDSIKTAKTIIEYAEKLGLMEKFLSFFSKPSTCVIFGSSGTGKTSLLKSIEKSTADFIDGLNRTLMNRRRDLKIDNQRFVFIDTPGHVHYVLQRNEAVREAITANRLLILNVVSFGFHETETHLGDVFDGDYVSADYLNGNRDLENEALNEWLEVVSRTAEPKAIITVANKADIWWSMRNSVLSYYMSGEYAKRICSIGYPHAVQPYCANIRKFYGKMNIDGTFDSANRQVLRTALLENLVMASASE